MEELGELAEAIRILPAAPGYFLSEAADVFAWLMHAQNLIEQKAGVLKKDRGSALEQMFIRSYPDMCLDCGSSVCSCPAILEATIGRIAHEVPSGPGTLGVKGSFLTADELFSRFQLTVPATIPKK
jgi:NAD-dependent dihydropyrimidine dehydrogenase PreA subunit